MRSGKNTWEIRLKAWWYRNFKYRSELIEMRPNPPANNLFDVLSAREGNYFIYLGNNKFIATKKLI